MQQNKKKWIFIITLIAVLIILAWFIFPRKNRTAPPQQSTTVVQEDPFASLVIPQKFQTDAATKQVIEQHINDAKKLYKEKPNVWESWVAIGGIRLLVEDYRGAIDAYKKSAKLAPNNPVSYRDIASVYDTNLRDNENAAYYYRLAIRNNPRDADLYVLLGNLQYQRLHNANAAETTYRDGALHSADPAQLMTMLVFLYQKTGDTQKYKDEVRQLIQKYPQNAAIYRRQFSDVH